MKLQAKEKRFITITPALLRHNGYDWTYYHLILKLCGVNINKYDLVKDIHFDISNVKIFDYNGNEIED